LITKLFDSLVLALLLLTVVAAAAGLFQAVAG